MLALFDSIVHHPQGRAMALPPPAPRQRGQAVSSRRSARVVRTNRSEAMNTMTYKNYIARIEFDERDNIFVGRVLGLRSIISFHGETVSELRHEFEVAIDDFLNDCKAQGITPEKPASGKLMLRVPPETHGAALVAAQAAGKSLNQWATEVLQSAAHV